MSKRMKIYLGILAAIIIAAAFVEISKPTPIDWRETYNERQTKPFDVQIFHKELATILYDGKIKNIYRTPYEFFNDQYDWSAYEYKIEGTYMSITKDYLVDFSSIHEILDYASGGNTVFISANDMPSYLSDSLGFSLEYDFRAASKATLSFANDRLKNRNSTLEKGVKNIYFSSIDTLTTSVLGYQEFENDSIQTKYANFIEVPVGKGSFLLHTQPIMFTNHTLLNKNHHRYSEGVLAYIPNEDVFFDSQNKIINADGTTNDSRFRFIDSQPPLRWAWYLSLLFLLIFILFNAKRKQRIVNIVKPLDNTTLDFTRTIGNLFYETKDHQNVVHKKITYFLEYLRTEYFMDTQVLDEKFCKRLHQKSGKSLEETERLVKLIKILQNKLFFDENDVLKITVAIENFRKKDN
ncbi:hypothetical protein KORDIASMS9_02721 [Kordia sp. SMS9]|uniref:DUF4350 domain-containing protein n=1 Tax=Kordia sp. SMS9 TaxID=2282170 RepID=UPI000E0D9B8B|nr:DUF4350 domain-containing protein [Kordia sp. SMS9]AXG70481.1 hypothetical protein KORDIASMS9_02721 [Kordia sp. SMS9]